MRSRKLPPGPGKRQALVERDQRERMMGAAVATFPEKGFQQTRVADLLEVSGVSRSTFYKHFKGKDACYLATLDAVLELTERRVDAGQEAVEGPWDRRLEALLATLVELIAAQPRAASLALVEVHAAGGPAIDALERTSELVVRRFATALAESPSHAGLPPELVRSFVGGLRMMALTRLREGREQELVDVVPALLDWIRLYEAPVERLRQPAGPPASVATPRQPSDDPGRRVIDAVRDLVAVDGYRELTINDIADRAAMSLTTFYGQFEGVNEAFLATLGDATERLLATTRAAYESTDDWPQAVNRAAHRFVGFLATDPAMARMGVVEAWATGPQGFELRAWGRGRFHELLEPGFAIRPDVPPIAAEAIGAAGDALLFDQLRRAGAARLNEVVPIGVFLVLAPFLGSDAAAAIANGEPHRS